MRPRCGGTELIKDGKDSFGFEGSGFREYDEKECEEHGMQNRPDYTFEVHIKGVGLFSLRIVMYRCP